MSMPLLNGIAAFKRATAPALLTKYASIPVVHVLFGVIRERTDKTPEAEGDGPHFEAHPKFIMCQSEGAVCKIASTSLRKVAPNRTSSSRIRNALALTSSRSFFRTKTCDMAT